MMDEMEQKICALVDARKDEIIAFAQDLWTHAELGFQEHRSAGKFAGIMKGLGLRAHPAPLRAEIARRRQQQDDGDGRDRVQKSFHGVTSVLRNSYTSITRLRQKTRDEKDGCNAGSDTL